MHRCKQTAWAGFVFLLWVMTACAGDDYAARLKKAQAPNDDKEAEAILNEWKHARPDDPEYYLAAAARILGRDTPLVISQEVAPGDLVGKDPITGQPWSIRDGKPSPAAVQRAIGLLKEATSRAPARIDIHLELAKLYEDSDDDAAVVRELSDTVTYAKAHADALLSTDGKPYPAPADENLSYAISAFAGRYFERETEQGNRTFLELAKLDLAAFPNREYGYNLMGNYYCTIDKNLKLALENYERALKFNPKDSLVLDNIGIVHMLAGEKKEAVSALEKVVALNNDPEYVEKAKRQLARLR